MVLGFPPSFPVPRNAPLPVCTLPTYTFFGFGSHFILSSALARAALAFLRFEKLSSHTTESINVVCSDSVLIIS